jgi:hypothetical protein
MIDYIHHYIMVDYREKIPYVRWEYTILSMKQDANIRTREQLLQQLNKLGLEGWEAVMYTSNYYSDTNGLLFKRRLP